MPRHLLLRLEAPLLAFGGEAIDAYGVIRDFPAKSMVAGLLGNALGLQRWESERQAALEARLVMGSALVRPGRRLRDFQTARLGQKDAVWSTRGHPIGRPGGGAETYKSPHIRYRDYLADALVLVAFRLETPEEAPTLGDLAEALRTPARPLFLGRKPCLPASPLLLEPAVEAADIVGALEQGLGALLERDCPDPAGKTFPAQWPAGEGERKWQREGEICDERTWPSGLHGGLRRIVKGELAARALGGERP